MTASSHGTANTYKVTQLRAESRVTQADIVEDALRLLASRSRPNRPVTANTQVINVAPTTLVTPDLRGTPSVTGMRAWLDLLGHTDADLQALNVIHVAGTKGKGSTCAFIEILLRTHGYRSRFPKKTGLYTSPHLVTPRERIRLDFAPIAEDTFARYFFEVYNKIEQAPAASKPDHAPRQLQLWALVAFHTFIKEKVDVAIIETHHGGEYDATNFLQEPKVTVVTTLGMDHIAQLGPALSNIAWHKAGIFKTGAAAISAPQDANAAVVLEARAMAKNVSLQIADSKTVPSDIAKQLPSDVLRTNFSVAMCAVKQWLAMLGTGTELDAADISQAVRNFSWPGRFQHLRYNGHDWYLEAAHNTLSMPYAAQFFAEVLSRIDEQPKHLVLVFSHVSMHRDGAEVLRSLLTSLIAYKVELTEVWLSSYWRSEKDVVEAESEHILGLFKVYSATIQQQYPDAKVHTALTVERVVQEVQRRPGSHILATGSQHLLGSILQSID